jgi:hypothetical protein
MSKVSVIISVINFRKFVNFDSNRNIGHILTTANGIYCGRLRGNK